MGNKQQWQLDKERRDRAEQRRDVWALFILVAAVGLLYSFSAPMDTERVKVADLRGACRAAAERNLASANN